MSVFTDNALISGVGARSDVSSLTSKTVSSKSALLPSEGLLRPVETLTTSTVARARTLHNSDSGKLFQVAMPAATTADYTVTIGADVSPGAFFEFVVTEITGTGNLVVTATGRTVQGLLNMNGAVTAAAPLTDTKVNILAAACVVGDSLRVTVLSATKIQFDALGDAAASFSDTA